jgi:hypothetical protein
MVLLQADEPSQGPQSRLAGALAGFVQVHGPSARSGQTAALRALVASATTMACSHVLWLENDWVTASPLPWHQIGRFPTVRLYGARKRLDDHPRAMAGTHHLGTKRALRWGADTFPGWEVGDAHWAAGGSIIETALLERNMHLPRLKDMQAALGSLRTARPLGNIMHSVGDETTPGFIP